MQLIYCSDVTTESWPEYRKPGCSRVKVFEVRYRSLFRRLVFEVKDRDHIGEIL